MLLFLLACTGEPLDTAATDTAPADAATVTGEFQIINALSGAPLSGATASVGDQSVETGDDGIAALSLPAEERFEVTVRHPDYMDYVLAGEAAEDDFLYITFAATRATTEAVISGLGGALNPSRGILVVSVDDPQLAPLTGASAAIDQPYDLAFVFTATSAELGDTLQPGGGSFVSFTNVPAGTAIVSVTPPGDEGCELAPALEGDGLAPIYADTVTVMTWICW